jgi:hypothetical protein
MNMIPSFIANIGTYNHNNFVCKNYIVNGLDNMLYDVYS